MAKSKGKIFTIGSKRENEGQLCIVGRAITIDRAIKKKKSKELKLYMKQRLRAVQGAIEKIPIIIWG